MIHEFDNPNFNEFKNELIEYSYGERKKDPIGVKVSNRNGWQSKPFKVTDKNNILHSFLVDSISNLKVIKSFINIRIVYWININPKGARNEKHTHPSCAFAGTIWIKTPENCGNFNLYSPFSHIGSDEKRHDKFYLYLDELIIYLKQKGYSFKSIQDHLKINDF